MVLHLRLLKNRVRNGCESLKTVLKRQLAILTPVTGASLSASSGQLLLLPFTGGEDSGGRQRNTFLVERLQIVRRDDAELMTGR